MRKLVLQMGMPIDGPTVDFSTTLTRAAWPESAATLHVYRPRRA